MTAPKKTKTDQLNLRLPLELKSKLAQQLEVVNKDSSNKTSLNSFVLQLLDKAVTPAILPPTAEQILAEHHKHGYALSTYDQNTFWAMVPKVKAESPKGRAFVHEVSQAQPGRFVIDFLVNRILSQEIAVLSGEAMSNCKDNLEAYKALLVTSSDSALENMGLNMSTALYRDGTGVIGTISSEADLSSIKIQLTSPEDVILLNLGMELDVIDSSGKIRPYGQAGHGLYVAAISPMQGTFSVSEKPGSSQLINANDADHGVPTIAVGDRLAQRGEYQGKVTGLMGWLPGAKLDHTDFFGVDRAVNPIKLAGCYLDGRTLSVEDAIIQATAIVGKQGGKVDHIFMSYDKFAALCKGSAAKILIRFQMSEDGPDFHGIELMTPAGSVRIYADRSCPSDKMFGLQLDTWQYQCLGEPVALANFDGICMLRQADSSGQEFRFYSMGNLVCTKPSANIVIDVTP